MLTVLKYFLDSYRSILLDPNALVFYFQTGFLSPFLFLFKLSAILDFRLKEFSLP